MKMTSDKIQRSIYGFLALMFGFLLFGTNAFAQSLSQDDQNSIYGDTVWYKPSTSAGVCSALQSGAGSNSTSPPSQNQIQIAKIIIGVAKTDNLGQQGALIGLMVGIDESTLTILANSNVPISLSYPGVQGVGSNGDSVGVFQQQPQYGWSTIATGTAALTNQAAVWQLMDPSYAAEAFFGSPPGSNSPSALSKGLQNVANWQSLQPWVAAQDVQHSGTADGSNYERYVTQAQALLNQYWDSSPAVPLPIPIGTGTGTSGSSSTSFSSFCTGIGSSATGGNSITQAVIQAGLAEIAKHIPYSYGGGGPYGPSTGICNSVGCAGLTTVGFDCSSFMQYVFYQGAQILLPRTAQSQYDATVGQGNSVQLGAIQPGDMMFFGSSKNNISHVDMYIGNNQVIQAPGTGSYLETVPMYTSLGPSEPLQGIGFYPPVGG